MSPLERWRYFSIPATGLIGSFQTVFARRKMPCRTTSSLFFVRDERCGPSEARHSSIIAGVMSSIRSVPKRGNRCASMIER